MRRRRFVGTVAGVAGSITLGGTRCDLRGVTGGGDVVLSMVATDYGRAGGGESSGQYWKGLVEDFERKHREIRVEVSLHGPGEAEEKVAALLAEGRAPDIAQLGSFVEHADADRLYRADELLSIPVNADFIPSLAAAGELRRVQYGIPFVADVQLLFYDEGLLSSAGLDPEEPPGTWADLQRAAVALKEAGVEIPYGLPFGPEDAHAEAMAWMLGNGGGYTADSGLYTINAPENVEALGWLRDGLVGRGLTTADPTATTRGELVGLFNRGRVGMLNGGLSLMREMDGGRAGYGMTPLPGNGRPSRTTLGTAHWMMAFRQNGHREAIGAFLDHVFAVERYYEFIHRHHMLPVTVSGSERIRTDERHESMLPFLDQLGSAEFPPVNKVSWTRTRREIGEHVGRAVLADGDPKSVLDSLQRTAEGIEDGLRS